MLCLCGCKQEVKPGNSFINGHNSRINNPMKNPKIAEKFKDISTWNKGLIGKFDRTILKETRSCACRKCGLIFECSKRSNKKYIHGHNTKGKTRIELVGEERAKEWNKIIGEKNRKHQLDKIDKFKNKKYFDTKPEIEMQNILKNLLIKYIKQKRIRDITISDIYIPSFDLYVFVDGNYWHNYPEGTDRDKQINRLLKERNIAYLRFWESDIYNDKDSVRRKLYEYCNAVSKL